jgi:hypothetical protein
LKWFPRIFSLTMLLACLCMVWEPTKQGFAKQQNLHRNPHAPCIILSLDGLIFSDVLHMPHLHEFAQSSAFGWVAVKTGEDHSSISDYLSTGSATKLPGSEAAGWNGQASEIVRIPQERIPLSFGQLYQRWTGWTAPASLVVPDLFEIQNHANSTRWGSHAGYLGDSLHEQGFRTAAIGNADDRDQLLRLAPLFLMDSHGIVDTGDVSADLLIPDAKRPYGVRLNIPKLREAFEACLKTSDVIVVQWGDLNRLDSLWGIFRPETFQTLRLQILQEADAFLGTIWPHVQQRHGRMLVTALSPLRDPVTGEYRQLSPLFLSGPGVPSQGRITSATTHREGLVSNLDLAPSIVQWMNQNHDSQGFLMGHPIQFMEHHGGSDLPDAIQKLQTLGQDLMFLNRIRSSVLSLFVHLSGIVLLGLMVVRMWKPDWLRYGKGALEAVAVTPLAMLVVPAFQPHQVLTYVLEIVLIDLCCLLVLRWIRTERYRFIGICLMTTGFILYDVLFHANWMMRSLLGYDVITGARYYGIGNEYMGVWLGSVLSAIVWMRTKIGEKQHTILAMLELGLSLVVTAMLALPQFGTNAGGAIAAFVGFAMVYRLRQNVSFWRGLLWSGTVVAGIGIIGMMVVNLWFSNGEPTHIGESSKLLLHGDVAQIWDMIVRKAALNLHLLQVSMWGTLLWITMAVIAEWWWIHRMDLDPVVKKGLQAILACALAAFACNDSGVLAAAAILLYACLGLFASEMEGGSDGEKEGLQNGWHNNVSTS